MATGTAKRRRAKKPREVPRTVQTNRNRKRSQGAPAMVISRTADDKGRVALGAAFANRAVIVEQLSETEVVVKLARVIPESEAWLYENPSALGSVRKGLAQARTGQLRNGPDVEGDTALAAELED